MRALLRGGAALFGLAAVAAVVFLGDHLLEAYPRDRFLRGGASAGPIRVTDMGPLPPELRESSGLAASRAHPGLFWSHNDSGDGPMLYAIDTTAALLGVVEVEGARAVDWEALGMGPCPAVVQPGAAGGQAGAAGGQAGAAGGQPGSAVGRPGSAAGQPGSAGGQPGSADAQSRPRWCLYVADTGNNARGRRTVGVHVVPEPDPRSGADSADALGTVHFSYPDGPEDAEAVAVTAEGDLVVVTKWGAPHVVLHRILAVDVRRAITEGDTLRLAPGRELPISSDFMLGGVVTGAALDHDDTILAVRTYTQVHFFEWPLADAVVEAAPACFLGGLQVQGEAVELLPDGHALLSTESPRGTAGRLLAVACAGVGEWEVRG